MNNPALTPEQLIQQQTLIATVGLIVANVQPLEEDYLRSVVDKMRSITATELSDAHVDHAIQQLMEKLSVSVDLGSAITSDQFKPWLQGRGDEISWTRWKAYKQYLAADGFPLKVLDRLDETSDRIIDLAGDPEMGGIWSRRGLVIGDVQSGKTATYLGILNKAADAGYKLIIILAGNTEQLRQQTQLRVDEGFIGRDSRLVSTNGNTVSASRVIGVGKFDRNVTQTVGMTTALYDFRKKNREVVNFTLNEMTKLPHIFVLKKNKTVLEGVEKWLREQSEGRGSLEIPLLLLDDESDYASVNTRDESDPTAINNAIRNLLQLSIRNSYLAFTATPFANIFIDHSHEDDLFPRDYIFALESPSNYVGAETTFGESPSATVMNPTDAGGIFPFGHKSQLVVEGLPESLEEAVSVFVLANAIRDLRGHYGARSMLINVSRFVRVQDQVFARVEALLSGLRNSIEFHSSQFAMGVENDDIADLKTVFLRNYADSGQSWSQVLAALPAAVRDIRVRLFNAQSDRSIDSTGRPPRMIAVGGDVLSRGVTLEGLVTSYFYRRAGAADTLMQMARWFGYRGEYEDLCRLWIDPAVADQFRYIHGSIEELRSDLKLMMTQNLTPRDFGLAVRDHPDSLLITARNKMRSASTEKKSISLHGRSVESTELFLHSKIVAANQEALETLVTNVESDPDAGLFERNRRNNFCARSVPKRHIANFLEAFRSSPGAIYFNDATLSRWARGMTSPALQTWDVVIISGVGKDATLGDLATRSVVRKVLRISSDSIRISGERGRIASAADIEGNLIDASLAKSVGVEFRKMKPEAKGVPESQFLPLLERPALLLYPIEVGDESIGVNIEALKPTMFVAAKIAVPGDRTKRGADTDVMYVLNTVAQELPRILDLSFEEDDDDF